MKRLLLIAAVAVGVAHAQNWEAGVVGGMAFTPGGDVSAPGGSVSAGPKLGPVFGAVLASNDYRRFGGQIGYLYRAGGFRLKGPAGEADFSGRTQFLDFRAVYHFAPGEAPVRAYAAAGGGAAIFSGTGTESSRQPLNNYAALTRTRQTLPVISAAVGVKVQLSAGLGLRFEVADYLTPFPDKVITPVPGAKAGKWLHNIVPVIGISGVF